MNMDVQKLNSAFLGVLLVWLRTGLSDWSILSVHLLRQVTVVANSVFGKGTLVYVFISAFRQREAQGILQLLFHCLNRFNSHI